MMVYIRNQLRQWYKNIPNLYHGSFRQKWIKALQHRSMKAAVTAKCQDCMNWQNTEVRECNVVTCPLWQYRPFRDRDGKVEAEVINAVTEIGKNEGTSNHAAFDSCSRKALWGYSGKSKAQMGTLVGVRGAG